jgi:hypothetical protein
MSDDLLHRAARALREDEVGVVGTATPPHPWHAMDGWSGIVKEVRRARRSRRLALVAGLQIGLALAGLGAWAAATGRVPVLFPSRKPAEATPATPPRRVRPRRPTAEVVPAEQPGPVVAVPSGQAPAAAAWGQAPLLAAPPRRSPVPAARAAEVAPRIDVATDPEVIYGEAHRAQFVRRDYAAALAAWDRYLALAPGPLTVEARYNRALALVRLQRRAEAAEALEPFASGYYGGYRREDARALLSLLRAPQP